MDEEREADRDMAKDEPGEGFADSEGETEGPKKEESHPMEDEADAAGASEKVSEEQGRET